MVKLEIHAERCKGCMFCVNACVKKVLEIGTHMNTKGYRYVVTSHPENCVGCKLCAVMCPDCAIEIYEL